MAQDRKKSGALIMETQYPSAPLLLEKPLQKNNILIGDNEAQVRFAEQYLSAAHGQSIVCQKMDLLTDDHLLGHDEPLLYRVERSSFFDLSLDVKAKTGIWSLEFISEGSTAANALVRAAATLIDAKPKKEDVTRVARELVYQTRHGMGEDLDQIMVSVWRAAWLLTAPPIERKSWPRPWENHVAWMPPDVDPAHRLHSLYWELMMYIFAAENDEKGWKRMGRPYKAETFKRAATKRMPLPQVDATLHVLSAWREQKSDPYICALKVAAIWETQ
jgi:hypothetical protein